MKMRKIVFCKKERRTESSAHILIHVRIVCAFEQIIDGNAEIIGYFYKVGQGGLSFSRFITAYCVLTHVQINAEFYLGYFFRFSQLFYSHKIPP